MSKTNFSFPGFNVTGNADTDRFSVDIGTLAFGGHEYVLHMMISANAPDHAVHSVASIERAGKPVWKYDSARDGDTFTRLTLVDDQPVIAFVDKSTERVVKVHAFSQFAKPLPLTVAKQIRFKRGAADFLGIEPAFTAAEESFRAVDPAEQRRKAEAEAKRAAEAAARQADAEAKRQKREERDAKRAKVRLLIAGRTEVKVRTDSGIKHGKPVLQHEIADLEPMKFYVLVDSIDESGVPHGPQKAFKAIAVKGRGIVMADGGVDATEFFDDKLVAPKSTSSRNFQLGEDPEDVFEVPIYANMADIQTLTKIGVAGVEFAAFPQGNKKFQVFVLNGMNGPTEAIAAGLMKPYTGQLQSQVA